MALAKWFIQVFHLEKLFLKDKETMRMVEALYRRQDKRSILIEIWCRRIVMLAVAVGVAASVFFICLCQRVPEDVIVDEVYLRPGTGQGQVTFGVEVDTDVGAARDEITVEVGEEERTDEQAVEIQDPRETILSEIRAAVDAAVSDGDKKDQEGRIELPGAISGKKIKYWNIENKKDFSSFYVSLIIIAVIPFMWRRQRQEQLKAREQQLVLDYPELVNKTMLLLSAGLTVRGCFERMFAEYRRRIEEGGERRYVYEEVSFSYQEMQNGVPESEVLEDFGRRCHQLPYLRFSSMVNQNIRKGSEGLVNLLEMGAMEAFEKRKEQVKRLGETAGTKLLIPMMLMLGVVMAVIIVPAFMTM